MQFTIPLGPQQRLTIGHGSTLVRNALGWWAVRWRKGAVLPVLGDDEPPPPTGVREPLVPRLPTLEGEIALPPDADEVP
jgi:hypothetical protein